MEYYCFIITDETKTTKATRKKTKTKIKWEKNILHIGFESFAILPNQKDINQHLRLDGANTIL